VDRHGSRSHIASSALRSAVAACALLGATIAPLALVVATVCTGSLGRDSLVVAAIAGGICWVAGATSLSISAVATRLGTPVQGVLLAMLFRMGLPLAAIVTFAQGKHALAASLAQTIVGVYLVTLVLETVLTLRMVPVSTATKAI
jgi:hypothetical protein